MDVDLSAKEIAKLARLDDEVKTAHKKLAEVQEGFLAPGRRVFFMHGSHLQQAEILQHGRIYWANSIRVRNIKTNKERNITLYDILCAYRSMGEIFP